MIDPRLAIAVAAEVLLVLGELLEDEPGRDEVQTADHVTEDLLRMFGLFAEEVHRLCSMPLGIDALDQEVVWQVS